MGGWVGGWVDGSVDGSVGGWGGPEPVDGAAGAGGVLLRVEGVSCDPRADAHLRERGGWGKGEGVMRVFRFMRAEQGCRGHAIHSNAAWA